MPPPGWGLSMVDGLGCWQFGGMWKCLVVALKTLKQKRKRIFYSAKVFPPRIKTNFYSCRQFFYMCRHVYTGIDMISSTKPQLYCPIHSSRKPQSHSVTFPFMANFCIKLSLHTQKKKFLELCQHTHCKVSIAWLFFYYSGRMGPQTWCEGKNAYRMRRKYS